jgi:hypothetical protein
MEASPPVREDKVRPQLPEKRREPEARIMVQGQGGILVGKEADIGPETPGRPAGLGQFYGPVLIGGERRGPLFARSGVHERPPVPCGGVQGDKMAGHDFRIVNMRSHGDDVQLFA